MQETQIQGAHHYGERQDKQHYKVDQGLGEIKSIISDLTIGLPTGQHDENNDQQIDDLKRALPSEIARVATKIVSLEKEHAQLLECKTDISQNLFQGLDEGVGGEPGADLRNLAAWRRLNEFRSDIESERKSIEMEAMRVENHILKLKDSKQWLTDMSIKINAIGVNTDFIDQSRIIKEFKGYLRKKIGLEQIQKEQDSEQRRTFKGQDADDSFSRDRGGQDNSDYKRERDTVLDRERNWLSKNLMPMTRI